MKETLLLFQIDKGDYQKITNICQQLDVQIKNIDERYTHETIGYLLGIDGFHKVEFEECKKYTQPLIFFAGMSEKQLDILLELFKMEGIKIPYKAMLTQYNIHYTFDELYQSIEEEYLEITQNK